MRSRRLLLVLLALALAPMGCAGPAQAPPNAMPSPPKSAPPSPEPRLLWVKGPSGKLRVEDGGEGGVPVVFVHGLAGSRAVWTAQLLHLRKTRRALALDLHGCGESEPSPSGDYSMASFAADVGAVADELRLQRFILVGHSMSGAVIGLYAGQQNDRIAGLFFVDPAGDISHAPKDQIERFMKGFAPERYEKFREKWFGEMLVKATPAVREAVLSTLRKTPREVAMKSFEGLVAYDPLPALGRYKGPMFLVYTEGNDDEDSLQKLLPELPNRLVPGVSHWLMMDQPESVNSLLDAFLKAAGGR